MGSYRPNAFGLHDVHGNVWEWCRERYGTYDKHERQGRDAELIVPGAPSRIRRGGDFDSLAAVARCARRGSDSPEARDCRLGVRAARDVSTR